MAGLNRNGWQLYAGTGGRFSPELLAGLSRNTHFETYCQNLNLEQLNVTIKTITGICSNYNNCIYFNLLSDPNFVSEDFYDADHLSEIGAEKLSKIINKKILEWK